MALNANLTGLSTNMSSTNHIYLPCEQGPNFMDISKNAKCRKCECIIIYYCASVCHFHHSSFTVFGQLGRMRLFSLTCFCFESCPVFSLSASCNTWEENNGQHTISPCAYRFSSYLSLALDISQENELLHQSAGTACGHTTWLLNRQ